LRQPKPRRNPRASRKFAGRAAANHPRRRGATRLGAEAGSATAARVIGGIPRRYQTSQPSKPRATKPRRPRIAPQLARQRAQLSTATAINSHRYQLPTSCLPTRDSTCSRLAATTLRLASRSYLLVPTASRLSKSQLPTRAINCIHTLSNPKRTIPRTYQLAPTNTWG
jgi:hypothetical protein